jgi:predicted PurR-regulated permease PerM
LLMVAVAYGVYVARELLLLIFVAAFIAISLEPLIGWLGTRGLGRRWGVAILVSAMVLVVGLFVWSLVPPLVEQGSRLLADLPEQLQRLSDRSQAVGEFTDRFRVTEAVSAVADQLPETLAGGAAGFVRGFFGGLASVGIVLGLAIYFMADLPRLRSRFVACSRFTAGLGWRRSSTLWLTRSAPT